MQGNRKLRLWPLWLLLAINIGWVLWIWRGEIDERQSRLMATMAIQVLMAFLAGLHLMFFARLSGKARLRLLFAGILFSILAIATVEIREVSGDVVPILAWRWSKPPEERLANSDKLGQVTLKESTTPSYPHFLGPAGNGILEGPALDSDWEGQPPQEQWRIEIGSGWAGFSIVGNLALTLEQRGAKEMTTCYNLSDGTLIWSQGQEGRYDSTIGGDGPRSTPTIDGDNVYTMGALGRLSCMVLTSGALLWTHDLAAEFGARQPDWGFAGSPLVHENMVMVNAGGDENRLLLAFDKTSGDLLWSSGNDLPGYSTPQLRTLAGMQTVIMLNGGSVTFHHPEDGRELLNLPWKKGQPNVANPLVLPGDRILVSSGYGVGAAMFKITADGAKLNGTQEWKNLRLKAKFANYVFRGDHLFGLDDGILTCVSWADGKRVWKGGRYGHGQLLLVDDKLLLQTEKGELILLEANPQERIELARFPVLNGKAWNTMAMSGNLLLMRNHREAVCLRLPVLATSASLP